jgi:hypothetical protein
MHSFAVDSDGNLYGADNQHGRIQKLVFGEGQNPTLRLAPAWIDE